jgi:hypothetical protein
MSRHMYLPSERHAMRQRRARFAAIQSYLFFSVLVTAELVCLGAFLVFIAILADIL